jgi:hypothetical protein
MAKQEDIWYLLRENGVGWKVSKIENGKFVASYRVNDAKCTCKAGEHERQCKHLDMVNGVGLQSQGKKITVGTARQIVAKVIRAIQDHFGSISISEMERQEGCEQMVVKTMLKASGIKSQDAKTPFKMIALVDGARIDIEVT